MFCSISWPHLNEYAPNFHNRAHLFMTIEKRANNPILTNNLILTSKLYILFHFSILSKQICSNLLEQGLFFVIIEKRGSNPIATSKLYILFCFLTLAKLICSKLSEQGSLFQDNWKRNILMGLVVCVRYVLNNILFR